MNSKGTTIIRAAAAGMVMAAFALMSPSACALDLDADLDLDLEMSLDLEVVSDLVAPADVDVRRNDLKAQLRYDGSVYQAPASPLEEQLANLTVPEEKKDGFFSEISGYFKDEVKIANRAAKAQSGSRVLSSQFKSLTLADGPKENRLRAAREYFFNDAGDTRASAGGASELAGYFSSRTGN